jgi:hypothetical protein
MAARRSKKTPQAHDWAFTARFRRRGFGWRSQPAVTALRQAVSEIAKVAKQSPVEAAEGAVVLLERLSPALEQVDSSSGAIGAAVNRAVDALVPVISSAPAEPARRDEWLERLFAALEQDEIPYLERLADRWGDLCASAATASAWADRLVARSRLALHPEPGTRRVHFCGTSACLSALFVAARHDELIALLQVDALWDYKQWAARALVAQGKKAEAVRYAEACRGPWTNGSAVDAFCEAVLLSSGLIEEAYSRYALRTTVGATYLAMFRAVVGKYPHKEKAQVLADLVASMPGSEGKWFAAAKEAGLYDEALALAKRGACDPKTLARAARDYTETMPSFAVEAGLLALHWLVQGYGHEITNIDVLDAYRATLAAAERDGTFAATTARIRSIVAAPGDGSRFVAKSLEHELRRP